MKGLWACGLRSSWFWFGERAGLTGGSRSLSCAFGFGGGFRASGMDFLKSGAGFPTGFAGFTTFLTGAETSRMDAVTLMHGFQTWFKEAGIRVSGVLTRFYGGHQSSSEARKTFKGTNNSFRERHKSFRAFQ
jgi:hypothetical protein